MNKNTKNNKKQQPRKQHTAWRTYNIPMPEPLIPIYNHLQQELNNILSNNQLMQQILNISTDLTRGNYWRELRWIIGDDFLTWGYGANAWYARMLYENIRRIINSGHERRLIHDLLQTHNNTPDDTFWDELHATGTYPKHGTVRNIQHEIANGHFTPYPTEATFVMDYTSVSDPAIERKIATNRWLFRTSKTSWLDIEILLPKNVRSQATGKIAKPRFVRKASSGEYTGCVSYEVLLPDELSSDRVLGVDLGIVKAFSASAVGVDGRVSSEYLVSRRTQRLIGKYDRVCDSLSRLLAKQARCEGLVCSERFVRRDDEVCALRVKRRRLRDEIVRLVALDIVLCALAEDCGEVHVERLSWLDGRGGYWNHAEVQAALMELAPLYGLHVFKVSAAYSSRECPVTGELGVVCDRVVTFGDGWCVDRDFLASVNVAVRGVGSRRKVDDGFRGARFGCARRVRRRGKVRKCLGDTGADAGAPVDYYDLLKISRLSSGGVDVVALSVGQGGLSPAHSIKLMAKTENLVSYVTNLTELNT